MDEPLTYCFNWSHNLKIIIPSLRIYDNIFIFARRPPKRQNYLKLYVCHECSPHDGEKLLIKRSFKESKFFFWIKHYEVWLANRVIYIFSHICEEKVSDNIVSYGISCKKNMTGIFLSCSYNCLLIIWNTYVCDLIKFFIRLHIILSLKDIYN